MERRNPLINAQGKQEKRFIWNQRILALKKKYVYAPNQTWRVPRKIACVQTENAHLGCFFKIKCHSPVVNRIAKAMIIKYKN